MLGKLHQMHSSQRSKIKKHNIHIHMAKTAELSSLSITSLDLGQVLPMTTWEQNWIWYSCTAPLQFWTTIKTVPVLDSAINNKAALSFFMPDQELRLPSVYLESGCYVSSWYFILTPQRVWRVLNNACLCQTSPRLHFPQTIQKL